MSKLTNKQLLVLEKNTVRLNNMERRLKALETNAWNNYRMYFNPQDYDTDSTGVLPVNAKTNSSK